MTNSPADLQNIMAIQQTPDERNLPSPADPSREWNLIWVVLRWLFRLFCSSWMRVSCSGMENLDLKHGGLLLINHQSFLDPLLIGLPLQRPISFVARDSLFKVPVVGWMLRNTYVMPISRESASSASLRETIRRMQHGFLVGIFPEGTRTETGEVGEFKPGFVALIRRAKLPVYPVGVAGAFQSMGKGSWFMKPVHVDPSEAVAAARVLEAGTSVGVHFGTFPQADDGIDEPAADVAAALARLRNEGVPPPRFVVPANGEVLEVPAAP